MISIMIFDYMFNYVIIHYVIMALTATIHFCDKCGHVFTTNLFTKRKHCHVCKPNCEIQIKKQS